MRVSDRGYAHPRNEDAIHVAALPAGVVAIVCDGVSASTTPGVADGVAHCRWGALLGRSPTLTRPRSERTTAIDAAQGDGPRLRAASDGFEAPPARSGRAWDGDGVTVGSADSSRVLGLDARVDLLTRTFLGRRTHRCRTAVVPPAAADTGPRHHPMAGSDAPDGRHRVGASSRRDGLVIVCSDGLWNYAPQPTSWPSDRPRRGEPIAADPRPVAHRRHAGSRGARQRDRGGGSRFEPRSEP